MKFKWMTLILAAFLIGLLVAGIPLVIQNEATQRDFDTYRSNANQSFEKIKVMNQKDIDLFQKRYTLLLIERNRLVEENKLLLDQAWYLIKNPVIITIIEERSHSSSTHTNDDEDECSPCPQLQRCPPGKTMKSDGNDACGCTINPRCVITSNIK